MKIDYANSWLPAIAEAIEERYIAIDEHRIVGYDKSALKTPRISETQITIPDFAATPVYPPAELKDRAMAIHPDHDRQNIRQLQEFRSAITQHLPGPSTALMDPGRLACDGHKEKDGTTLPEHMTTAAASIPGTFNLKEMIDLQANNKYLFTRYKLEPMIRSMWKLLSPQIEEKDAHLSLNLIIPILNYVKAYLENSLFNLINNAITYTLPGVVPDIRIETWEEGDNIVLMVQDNGIGIDFEKHQEQLFQYKRMFHRGYGSNGVGLLKIRNQIRTFGGNMEVKSESGIGRSSYVYFNNRVHTLQQDE